MWTNAIFVLVIYSSLYTVADTRRREGGGERGGGERRGERGGGGRGEAGMGHRRGGGALNDSR